MQRHYMYRCLPWYIERSRDCVNGMMLSSGELWCWAAGRRGERKRDRERERESEREEERE